MTSEISINDASGWKKSLIIGGSIAVYAILLSKFNTYVPEPYMDEPFHVRQTQQYCLGRFHYWDPKITTFPGLYLFALPYAYVSAIISGVTDRQSLDSYCSLSVLRSINVVFAIGNLLLIFKLRQLVMPHSSWTNHCHHVLMIASFPIHFFYTFLFYTDGGATFFVLLMYYLAETIEYKPFMRLSTVTYVPSAFVGLLAIAFRQTNVIWVLFVAGTAVVRYVELSHASYIYGSHKDNDITRTKSMQTYKRMFINFLVVVMENPMHILQVFWPFILTVLAFITFVVFHGSIVLGDKSNHEMTLHFAQVFYSVTVIASGFGISFLNPSRCRVLWNISLTAIRKPSRWVMVILILCLSILMVQYGSPTHPFLLADNRHYTFYVWKNIFRKHWAIKFACIPFYIYCSLFCLLDIRLRRSALWVLVFVIAVALVLIPSPLVEPRYYLLPFIIFHINSSHRTLVSLRVSVLLFAIVNVITIYIFLFRPYVWVDGTIARFMW